MFTFACFAKRKKYKKMMNHLISQFPQQLRDAVEIGRNTKLKNVVKSIENVMVTGLGGSGMGADVVIDLLNYTLSVPMLVNKGYHLPEFVSTKTLLIASSYSGNTEETVLALKEGIEKEANICCITSGGEVLKIAKRNTLDYILIPDGMPPRSCLGYSFVQQLFILNQYGLITDGFSFGILNAAKLLENEMNQIKEIADSLAEKLIDKLPIIYVCDGYSSVALRWKQQINENAKMHCWYHTIPEMNHNELVAWRNKNEEIAPVFLDADDIFLRNKLRQNISMQIIKKYTPHVFKINAIGNNKYEKILSLIYIGDWLSWYLAERKNVDATEIEVINYLKNELSNQ